MSPEDIRAHLDDVEASVIEDADEADQKAVEPGAGGAGAARCVFVCAYAPW